MTSSIVMRCGVRVDRGDVVGGRGRRVEADALLQAARERLAALRRRGCWTACAHV